jgi:hypothetical protein
MNLADPRLPGVTLQVLDEGPGGELRARLPGAVVPGPLDRWCKSSDILPNFLTYFAQLTHQSWHRSNSKVEVQEMQ